MACLLDMKRQKKGELGRSQDRLRELSERACRVLDARTLDVLSFHCEAYLAADEHRERTGPKLVSTRRARSCKVP
jgi:hypothetical protein